MINVGLVDKRLKEKGWREADLARALDTHRQHINYILRVSKSCRPTTLSKIAKALGLTMNEIWKDDDEDL